MNRYVIVALASAVVAIAGMLIAQRIVRGPVPDDGTTSQTAAVGKHQPAYWYDPMRPEVHFDKPGKSPFMDMQLVPKSADETHTGGTVRIDPRMVQKLGIRTAAVQRGPLPRAVRTTGNVLADETRIEIIQARAAGWVEKLYVRAINEPVHRGQLLAEVYSPDLYAAQEEFVLARRAGDQELTSSASRRLMLLGVSARQLAQLEKSGEAQRRVAYYAPYDGIVTELGVREGAQISPGVNLFSLVDLAKIWITAEVPEAQVQGIRPGGAVEASIAALTGRIFAGTVQYVYPQLSAETRTVRVRAVMDNHEGLLKPGMYAAVIVSGESKSGALLVPSEALIRTGTRSVVIVAEGEGRFRPAAVNVGEEANGRIEIREGLAEGQQVVTSGQFLIDSEANLSGAFKKMDGEQRR